MLLEWIADYFGGLTWAENNLHRLMSISLINLKFYKCAMVTIETWKWFVNKKDYHDNLYSYRENSVTVLVIPVCGSKAADFYWKKFRKIQKTIKISFKMKL